MLHDEAMNITDLPMDSAAGSHNEECSVGAPK